MERYIEKIAFNSLYEIPKSRNEGEGGGRLFLSILFMRFPEEEKDAWRKVLDFFQFSLWDPRREKKTNKKKVDCLSILFMRFTYTEIANFSFLLHLSILFMRFMCCQGREPSCSRWPSFNSLYEIRKKGDPIMPLIYSFNSLYEIRMKCAHASTILMIFFQFSLWDSQCMLPTMCLG